MSGLFTGSRLGLKYFLIRKMLEEVTDSLLFISLREGKNLNEIVMTDDYSN